MAIIRTWSGNGLSAGSLTTSSAGTGDDAFDFITGSPTIVATGTRSPQIQVSGVNQDARWIITAQTVGAGRFYYTTPSAWATAAAPIAQIIYNSTTATLGIWLSGTGAPGQMRIYNGATQLAATATSTLSVSTLYRFEWTINHGTGSATIKCYLGDSTTEVASLTQTSTFQASHNVVAFGIVNGAPTVGTSQLDDMAVADAATLIGPAATGGSVTGVAATASALARVPAIIAAATVAAVAASATALARPPVVSAATSVAATVATSTALALPPALVVPLTVAATVATSTALAWPPGVGGLLGLVPPPATATAAARADTILGVNIATGGGPAAATIQALPPTIAASAITTATLATATATAIAPTFSASADILAPVATASAAALAPTVGVASTITATVATASAAGLPPVVTGDKTVVAVAATASALARVPVVTASATLATFAAEASADAMPPALTAAAVVTPPPATATATAAPPVVSVGAAGIVQAPPGVVLASAIPPVVTSIQFAVVAAVTATATASALDPAVTALGVVEPDAIQVSALALPPIVSGSIPVASAERTLRIPFESRTLYVARSRNMPKVMDKDPSARLPYKWDWAAPSPTGELLLQGDAITDAVVTCDDPTIAVEYPPYWDAGSVVAWVSGGTPGTTAKMVCRITTAGGATDERTISLRIRQR